MVAFASFVSVTAAVLLASELAAAVPATGPSLVIDQLTRRQTSSPVDPNDVAPQCRSSCNSILGTLDTCKNSTEPIKCICTDSNMDTLTACLSCEAGIINNDDNTKSIQSFMDGLTSQCKAGGSPVKSETIVAKKNGAFSKRMEVIGVLGSALAFATVIL
ncbi:hypothetical protein HGRIS_004993 [Hohenbuehelia grisea]|uniref:Uncharacterized protein n=1 Tax=Hohenbuehelia grisea TaxID=104357 RepID=A0ABR3JEK1_9AGAR